jgi:hypothetical protein
MLRKIVVGGLVAVMIAAVVIGVVQLVTPAAEAQGRGPGRTVEEGTSTGQSNGRWGQAGGRNALVPDEGTALGAQGQGRGYGGQAAGASSDRAAAEQPQGGHGQRGQGQGGSASGIGTGEPQAEVQEWVTVEGTVIETAELVIETAQGEMVQVGLGPSHYREGQGFALSEGDQVRVSGYWEDGEFKAGEVENLDSGAKITLRDAYGRPMWSGQGRRNS